jgi:N-acetylneuraminic acid mutarotase
VTQHSSAAVVNNILYVFGGDNGVTAPTNAVWAYSPTTKAWTSMAPMLTARNGTLAVVEKNIVYVMGGNLGNGANFVATVESYNPATNTWTEETPMDGAKDYPAGGLIGTTIVSADGAVASGQITGDTEGYNATTNAWSDLTADPTARTGSCSGVISSALYDVGGYINNDGAATTVNESYSLSTNKWTTTLLPIPQGTMYAASAVDNGQLYCFGGLATLSGSAIGNVQIYQP